MSIFTEIKDYLSNEEKAAADRVEAVLANLHRRVVALENRAKATDEAIRAAVAAEIDKIKAAL